jgi:CBS-domain-containing membrane protein
MDEPERDIFFNIEISDDDIYDAMKDIQGYLDITAEDFRELYRIALKHAVERVANHARASEFMTSPVTVHTAQDSCGYPLT